MAVEKTLVIVKPDAMFAGWLSGIHARYKSRGFKICDEYKCTMSRREAKQFYAEHEGKFFFPALVLMMSSDTSYVMILEGEDAIQAVRILNGATDPSKAEPGTIRCDYRSAGGPFNTVHSSDSPEAFAREYELVKNWRD